MDKETKEVVDNFLRYVETKSIHSEVTYRMHLYGFFKEIKKNYKLIKDADISKYITIKNKETAKKTKGTDDEREEYGRTTKNTFIAILSSFYRYQKQFEISEDFKRFRKPTSKKTPVHIKREQIKKFFEATLVGSRELQIRDNLIVRFIYATGCRRSEVANFKTDYLKLDETEETRKYEDILVEIVGKGGRTRRVLVPAWMVEEYAEQFYYPYHDKEGPYMFYTRQNTRISESTIYRIVKEKARQAGVTINGKIPSPHKLRSTYAREYLESGGKLETLQELMGHASINTTRIYTDIPEAELKKIKPKKL